VSHLPLFLESPKNCRFIVTQSGQGRNCFLYYGFRMAQNLPRIYNRCRFGAACVCSCSFELLSRQLLLLLLLLLFSCCGPPSLSPPPPSPPFSLPPHFSFLLFIVVASWILCKLFLPIWLWACFYQVLYSFFFFFVDVVSSCCCLCSQLLLWLSSLLCVFSLSLSLSLSLSVSL